MVTVLFDFDVGCPFGDSHDMMIAIASGIIDARLFVASGIIATTNPTPICRDEKEQIFLQREKRQLNLLARGHGQSQ